MVDKNLPPCLKGGGAFQKQINVFFYFLQRHASILQTADCRQPFQVGVGKLADAALAALHKGEQAFLVIIAEGIDAESGLFRYFLDRVDVHRRLSFP
ncbi:hypothetical protein SDC9_172951 [bioreactor metagenome]|uniref:Uncharacterized protein n=1 Tax=bioreactor metagenome TaxID=1076179 RepID=A0A645GIC7_9ZZZZ